MTGFDIIVLLIVAVAAVGGFLRGFVQEVLSLASWVLAVFAIRSLHTDLTAFLFGFMGTPSGAALFAFAILLLISYAAMKLIALRAGKATRNSFLGPFDRVLGFGFGAVKGVIMVIMAFALLVLGYDTAWGPTGRPVWITTARTYPFVNASADAMVQLIDERQRRLSSEAAEEGVSEDSTSGAQRLYTPESLALAVDLAHWPRLAAAPLHGEARSPACGSTLAIDLELDAAGRIERLGMAVRACAVGQAAAAIFAAQAAGRDARAVAGTLAGLEAWLAGEGPVPDWPGLAPIEPARAYPARHGAMLLPWKAALAALSSTTPAG